MKKLILTLSAINLSLAVTNAAPIPNPGSCVGTGGFTCSFYEYDNSGKPTERPPAIPLPVIASGFLVVTEPGAIDQTNPNTWTDIVSFFKQNNTVYGQLFSDPFDFATAGAMPFSVSDIVNTPGTTYIAEDASGFAQFVGCCNTYNVFSDGDPGDAAVPEPSFTLPLAAALIIGAVRFRRRQPAR